MTGRGGGGGRKVLLPPINFIFKLLQSHATVKIWLYEQLAIRIEGKIRVWPTSSSSRRYLDLADRVDNQGFDEFMNLVIDDAVEVKQVTKTNPEEKRRQLGTTQRTPEPTALRFCICLANGLQAKFYSRATTFRSSRRRYEGRGRAREPVRVAKIWRLSDAPSPVFTADTVPGRNG